VCTTSRIPTPAPSTTNAIHPDPICYNCYNCANALPNALLEVPPLLTGATCPCYFVPTVLEQGEET